jgi:hypothetical protein
MDITLCPQDAGAEGFQKIIEAIDKRQTVFQML